MADTTTSSNALFRLRICLLRQPTTSPTNVATLTDKMEKLWGLALGVAPNSYGGGTLLLVELGMLASLKLHFMNQTTHISTKDIPISPRLVKALEHSFSQEDANLNLLNYAFPCCLGVHDEIIPDNVFNLRLMPLFMTEHLVIELNPDCPK